MDQLRWDPGTIPDWADAEAIIAVWYRRARESQFAHYKAADRCTRLSRRLGVPSVLLCAAAGTTLFATLENDGSAPSLRLVVGLVTLLAGALTGLQTFLGLPELANKHRSAAASYGAIRREIEQWQSLPPTTRSAVKSAMESIRNRLDDVALSVPDVPERAWKDAQRDISHTDRPSGFRRLRPPPSEEESERVVD